MPRSLNKVLLIGYIADEPTIRDFAPDRKVANLTLVTNDYYRNPETGVNEEVPEWHRLSCWGNSANTVEAYVHKGSRLYVEGRIKTRNYVDRDGNKRYATDIRVDNLILLDTRRDAMGNGAMGNGANAGSYNSGTYNGADNSYQPYDGGQTGRSDSFMPQNNMRNSVNVLPNGDMGVGNFDRSKPTPPLNSFDNDQGHGVNGNNVELMPSYPSTQFPAPNPDSGNVASSLSVPGMGGRPFNNLPNTSNPASMVNVAGNDFAVPQNQGNQFNRFNQGNQFNQGNPEPNGNGYNNPKSGGSDDDDIPF